MNKCPVPYALFALTVAAVTITYSRAQSKITDTKEEKEEEEADLPSCQVVFVLGGPGSGKGTQCQLISERTKGAWVHLSAGDLLRAERKRAQTAVAANGSGAIMNNQSNDSKDLELANIIQEKISTGQLVPSSITVRLLEKAMKQAYYGKKQACTHFLIDGFPRSEQNMQAWNERMSSTHNLSHVLDFQCPEEVLVGRLLERAKTSGRVDDNLETIRKRFQTHQTECQPILAYYKKLSLLHVISSDKPVEEVYKQVSQLIL